MLHRAFNSKKKAQAAIEYLMTYGWAILVVTIVAGAIFSFVGQRCTRTTSGFIGGDVEPVDFGLNDQKHIAVELRNKASDPVIIENISIGYPYNETVDRSISVGESSVVEIAQGFHKTGGGCEELNMKVEYRVQGGINGTEEGVMTAPFVLGYKRAPSPPNGSFLTTSQIQVDYSQQPQQPNGSFLTTKPLSVDYSQIPSSPSGANIAS
ncbi:MAG: hypothetical protein ABEJ87_01225 [Candidatus Nanohalobium sp.]